MSNFLKDEADEIKSKIRMHVLKDPTWDLEKRYEVDYSWQPREINKPEDVRTTAEMLSYLEKDPSCVLDAKVLHFKEGKAGVKRMSREGFREAYLKGNSADEDRFMESFAGGPDGAYGGDSFSQPNQYGNTVGNDFTPLLGGPFYKQLYYYNDWLKAHQDCFFAFNHDPVAKATNNIMLDFTLGKGYQVQCSNGAAQALWDAFETANDFQGKMRKFALELSIYGEDMLWWLPQGQKYIDFGNNATGSTFNLNAAKSKDDILNNPKAKLLLPRARLVDPSNFVEIITHPEDIDRRIAYVWCTPTQYQTYTAKDPATGELVNASKFIYQQIPAEMIDHVAINCVSNEKRGRGDCFTGLPYFKRLRDTVNYSMVSLQKNAAWCMDTTIDGNDQDIQAYMDAQRSLGSIPPAGSEFVHTKAIERKYNANQGGESSGKAGESIFQVGMSMACTSVGIPVSYYGTHLSAGGTRASAIVATEPVAKKFEMRQQVYKAFIERCAERLFRQFGIKTEIDVYFPEIVTQDRSSKLKDLFLAEGARWISPERAATSAAKELGADHYDYEKEMADIQAQQVDEIPQIASNPLSGDPAKPSQAPANDSETAVTKDEKKSVNDSRGF